MKVEVYFPPDYPGGKDFRFCHEAKATTAPDALKDTYEALSDVRSHTLSGRYVMLGDVFTIGQQDFIVGPNGFRPVTKLYVEAWIKKPLIERITGSGTYEKVISYSAIPVAHPKKP